MNRFLKKLFLKEDDVKPEDRFSPQYISHFRSVTGFDPPTTQEEYDEQKNLRRKRNTPVLTRFKEFLMGKGNTPTRPDRRRGERRRNTSDTLPPGTQFMLPGFDQRSGKDRRN